MSCCSVPSHPANLQSSVSLAIPGSAIGLSDLSRPPIAEFNTE